MGFYSGLTQKLERILDVLVYSNLRYFVISTQLGPIYVFKYIHDNDSEKTLLHTFTGHYKGVPSIAKVEQYTDLLCSVSYDKTVRIYSLTSF
jgi:WD40 repeat protein